MAATLGFGKRRLITEIIKNTWGVENNSNMRFGINDILYIIQEMEEEEGKKHLTQTSTTKGFAVFRKLAEHLLYRNLANYDSMVLLTSEKGCLTDDTLLMVPRDLTKYPDGVPLKDLINKGPIKVYSFNKETKKLEIKQSDGVEFAKYDDVYELTFTNNMKIKSTANHPFMTKDGSYIEARDLKYYNSVYYIDYRGFISLTKIKNKKYLGKQNVYDVVNVRDNHNFIGNGFVVSNTGKCVYIKDDKDFVVSANGELVHPKDAKEIVFMDDNMKLKTGKVKKRFKRPEKEVFEVLLRSGRRICLTKEHPLFTINGWNELKSLDVGDFIATPRKYNLNNNQDMNKGLVKLLAYLIADGFMGGRKLEFTKQNIQIRKDFKKSLAEYDDKLSWGESVRIVNKDKIRNDNGEFVSNNSLMNYLKKIGLYEKRSGNKFIPNEIMVLKNELIALFLNRLYSCDGGVEIGNKKCKTREINYTSKSELMIRQLQHLLLRFNILSSIKHKFKKATNSINHKGNIYWQLTISGKENIINFYKHIGFFHKEKQDKLKIIYNDVRSLNSNTNVDVIPCGVLSKYDFKTSFKKYAEIFNVKTVRLNQLKNFNISLRKFKQIANAEQDDRLLQLANSDIFWDKIISITQLNKKEVTVYDLEIDDHTHNFVCNDIIVHNSSAAIMLARFWCQLIGIRFDPARHLAYSNKDVMEKIDMLGKFEPLVCLTGDTLISVVDENGQIKHIYINKLDKNKHPKILTYNKKDDKFESKTYDKVIKTKTNATVYELVLDGIHTSIKCTHEHKFLTEKNGWVQLKNIKKNDRIKYYVSGQMSVYFDIKSITKLEEKEDVFDIINVEDNHNFVANNMVVHNCDESVRFASAADWNRTESKELRKKLAEVRTKHLLFVLCFPLKIYKMEKNYLECLDGNSLIKTEHGYVKIKDLEGIQNFKVYSLNKKTNKIELKNAKSCIKTKYDYVYEIKTESGTQIFATKDHRFLTEYGWKHLHEMSKLDKIKQEDLSYSKIISITKKDKRYVYDILDVEDNHNYIANDFIVHNSFVNYWCITGDTNITTRDKTGMIRNTPVKKLNKYNPEVLSYNIKTQKYEFKKYYKKIKTKKNAEIFELELDNGLKIKCTDDHPFLTQRGWVPLKYLKSIDKIKIFNKNSLEYSSPSFPSNISVAIESFRRKCSKIKKIRKLVHKEDVYDIIGVKDNNNFVANNMVVHNCDLFGRGLGAIYVKDRNPVNDSWRMKDFKNVGSYTEFTRLSEVEKKLKKHPNFWQIIKFPKPPEWLYTKYLKVRESNVYNDDNIRDMVTTVDIHKSLLLLALQDIMMNDTTLNMNRISLHIKNQYDIPITKKHIQGILLDAKQLVTKIREESVT